MPNDSRFLEYFRNGNVAAAKVWLVENPQTLDSFQAHSLVRQFVTDNHGHCHRQPHLQIAEFLIPGIVKALRKAVLDDNATEVKQLLIENPGIVHAEFTGARGISQAVHCFVSTQVGQLLIDEGADVNALNSRGETPLTMQCRFGSMEVMRVLLENGADPNQGPCPHMPSATLSRRIELLQEYGWKIGAGQLLHDSNHGLGQRIRTWLQYGVDPNKANEQGQTALHIFATRGTGRDAILALVEAGANINARDDRGQTPLALARRATKQMAASVLEELAATE